MALCKFRPAQGGAPRWGWIDLGRSSIRTVDTDLATLLRMEPEQRASGLSELSRGGGESIRVEAVQLSAPVDRQEIWAAGVTYARSRDARMEESSQQDVYDKVYDAERPEIFFKSTAERCVGPGGTVGIRHDSAWNVPEPELAIVLDSRGRIAGYTIGNDVSSRSIEGENPLYLPQAKVYTASCAVGPWIAFPDEVGDPLNLGIRLKIVRPSSGGLFWSGDASTSQLHRGLDELAGCLYDALDLPDGSVLLTGTCIVPPAEFTLAVDDVVTVEIDRLGALVNTVVLVGGKR